MFFDDTERMDNEVKRLYLALAKDDVPVQVCLGQEETRGRSVILRLKGLEAFWLRPIQRG